MANDWAGAGGASWRERAERVVREAVRRAKLEAQNDPNFVPPPDDVSSILAARHYAMPVPLPDTRIDEVSNILAVRSFLNGALVASPSAVGASGATIDASLILAASIFGRRGSSGGGARLTFGTYLTGGSYDGLSPVTLATNAVSTNTVSTLVARDTNGDFAARQVTADLIGKLVTPRTINGVAFDGSANITIPAAAGTLTGTVLNATVVTSSLTTLGAQAADLSFTPGFGLALDTGGTADMAGTATMVAGTVTKNTTAIGVNSKVIYNRATTGGTVGHLSYTKVNGTSITFNSSSATDTSSIDWMILNTF